MYCRYWCLLLHLGCPTGVRGEGIKRADAGALRWIVVGSIVFMIFVSIPYKRFVRNCARKEMDREAILSRLALSSVSTIRTVRHHQAESLALETYVLASRSVLQIAMKLAKATGLYVLVMGMTTSTGLAFSLWRAATLVIDGSLTQSNLVVFFLYVDGAGPQPSKLPLTPCSCV